jgi:hypothetical protein
MLEAQIARELKEFPQRQLGRYYSVQTERRSFWHDELLRAYSPPLGPLSTAAIEYHRVETRRRGDEQPMFSPSTEAQIRYSLWHKNLAH